MWESGKMVLPDLVILLVVQRNFIDPFELLMQITVEREQD